MKVRATADGYYAGSFRPAGEVFELVDPRHEMSWRWMEAVDDSVPCGRPAETPSTPPLRGASAAHVVADEPSRLSDGEVI